MVEIQWMSSLLIPRKLKASAQPSTLQVFEPVPVSTVGASKVTVQSAFTVMVTCTSPRRSSCHSACQPGWNENPTPRFFTPSTMRPRPGG